MMDEKMINVLLVEDSPSDTLIVEAELTHVGGGQFCVVHFDHLNAALDQLRAEHFDVVLLDLNLPDSHGLETFLRLYGAASEIPIVVLSGEDDQTMALKAVQAGAQDYLVKGRMGKQVLQRSIRYAIERQRCEQTLAESEERMRAILESALDAVVTMDRQGEIVEFNPAAEKIFGFRRDTAIGKSMVDLIIPKRLRENHKLGLELYLKTGEARMLGRRVEVTALRADGSEFPAEMAVTRIGSKEPLMFTAFVRDIGEKLRGQTALRESEERLQRVIANLTEGLIISDIKGELLDWNPAALEMHGLTGADQWRFKLSAYAETFELSTLDGAVLPVEEWPLSRIFRGDLVRDFEAHVRRIGTDWERVFSFGGATVHDPAWGQLAFVTINDITEQKNAEEKLRRQEKQYRVLFATYPSPTWVYDAETLAFLAVNDAAVDHYGYSRDQFLAMTIRDIRPPEDIPALLESGTVASEKPQAAGVWRHLKKNGEIILAEIFASSIQFEGRRAQLAIAIDVTEQRKGEETIRESESRLRAIIDNEPECVKTVSSGGLLLEMNAAGLRMIQAESAAQIRGRPVSDLVHPEDRGRFAELHRKACGGEAGQLQYRVIGLKGRERLMETHSVGLRNGAGTPCSVLSVTRDVTDQRAGEVQIREQARLLDLAQDAIMVRSMEDRILYWNGGAEKLYGWTAAEVRGTEAYRFLYKDEAAAAAIARASLLENGKWTGECKQICKAGGQVTVRSRWTLVRDEAGTPKSVLIIDTDITEQKKIEEQFLRAQRLESIGTLASGVAHDLNNILAPILMGAAVLRRSEMAEADGMILSTIETCAQRGADIVKQVLTFARGAEGARLLLQPAHLINDMAKIAEGTFPKAITVQTSYPQLLWPIEGDPTQLHQVLLNLCVNARDAMPAGGTLTIGAQNFPVDEHYASMTPGAKAGPHVLLEVKDTGMGIPREIIHKVFDPFFTTKKLGHGTGLGLSTVIGIVKSHGGFLSVESDIGQGTTFKIYLPAKMITEGVLPDRETTIPPMGNDELLLIVDDEKPILEVAEALLEGHGYRVLRAADATEALAIFALHKDEIAVVLTDLAMPVMDGLALIRTLQKMKPDVRIVASSGHGSLERSARELPSLNVRACLTKPYNKETLLNTLHDALNHQTDKI
jgi:PAS domain S-box-containing protein